MNGSPMTPPMAKRAAKIFREHGRERVDWYYWMRDRDNPEVRRYLEAENAYVENLLAPFAALRDGLYAEMVARLKEDDSSYPYSYGNYFYYTRTVAGGAFRIHCRKLGSLDAGEQILLDENQLAAGHDYFHVGHVAVSPDHRLLAYLVDTQGDERYELRFRDLQAGADLPGRIPAVEAGSVAWANDSQTVVFATLDALTRPYEIYRIRAGAAASTATRLLSEADERYFLFVHRCLSGRFIVVSAISKVTSWAAVVDANDPESGLRVLAPPREGVEYSVEHQGDRFLILTNRDAPNFRVMQAPTHDADWAAWRELIPARPQVYVMDLLAFSAFVALLIRRDGQPAVEILDCRRGELHAVAFSEPVFEVDFGANMIYEATSVRLGFESPITPPTTLDYDMATREQWVRKVLEVRGYEPEAYRSERVWAPADGGALVPISLAYRRDLADGSAPRPLYLEGYGAYGFPLPVSFSQAKVSLMDRGIVVASAHVRGGSDLGRSWYDDGKLLRKRNTIGDFAAAARHLVHSGRAIPGRLAAYGASAGGLLIGAVLNEHPALFEAVIADVPFVDLVTTMLDPTLPLTVTEWEEWGDPRDKVFYDYMMSYSPYDNVGPRHYPHVLLRGGFTDPRVPYWEPAKMAAKLREHTTSGKDVLLLTQLAAGHMGASGRYERFREVAANYCFILWKLGLAGVPPAVDRAVFREEVAGGLQ
ncbi:MAG: S9 family peptidase [Candidatus Schekmanbacteria bacterium]|nr:S9 family peptidase [Candidatus Schekmanbacteria bacterium]